jgi:hypothetical protein
VSPAGSKTEQVTKWLPAFQLCSSDGCISEAEHRFLIGQPDEALKLRSARLLCLSNRRLLTGKVPLGKVHNGLYLAAVRLRARHGLDGEDHFFRRPPAAREAFSTRDTRTAGGGRNWDRTSDLPLVRRAPVNGVLTCGLTVKVASIAAKLWAR